jgi:hypothetical protein
MQAESPVAFFMLTRLVGISLNATYSLLASLGLQMAVCQWFV